MGIENTLFGGGTDTSNLRAGSDGAQDQLRKGIKKGKESLTEGRDTGIASLAAGLKAAQPYYEDASNNFSPYMEQGQQGQQAYIDSLGLNGDTGYANTLANFHQGPGFQFALDAANQNIMRNNAALGGLASGGTYNQLGAEAQGRQNQEFGGWQDRLAGLGSQGLQAAGQQAGVLQALGGITNQSGINKAGIQTDTGARLADLFSGGHGAMATNKYNLGLGLQNQEQADVATQAGLIQAIISGGSKAAGAFAGGAGGAGGGAA
jgi:hypothetical protein